MRPFAQPAPLFLALVGLLASACGQITTDLNSSARKTLTAAQLAEYAKTSKQLTAGEMKTNCESLRGTLDQTTQVCTYVAAQKNLEDSDGSTATGLGYVDIGFADLGSTVLVLGASEANSVQVYIDNSFLTAVPTPQSIRVPRAGRVYYNVRAGGRSNVRAFIYTCRNSQWLPINCAIQ